MRFNMFCRSNSATTSPFLTRPPGFGSSSNTSDRSPPPRQPPPPPPPPMEPAENMPPAVDPSGFDPELSEPPEDFELELLDADAARSEKRLVEPRLAPRLDAAGCPMPPAAEPSE